MTNPRTHAELADHARHVQGELAEHAENVPLAKLPFMVERLAAQLAETNERLAGDTNAGAGGVHTITIPFDNWDIVVLFLQVMAKNELTFSVDGHEYDARRVGSINGRDCLFAVPSHDPAIEEFLYSDDLIRIEIA